MTDPKSMTQSDIEEISKFNDAFQRMRKEIGKAVVGQAEVVDQLLMAVFARGHCLLVGVPGLAKTLLVSSLADTMSLSFKRIQFTPDLMPSDITGTDIIQEDKVSGTRELKFVKGPIFANMLLADEINRTPPKTQAALLEAMQEGHVTASGTRHMLDKPFFVLATQNPIEQEGTYPLPEAQLDRFMFMIKVNYPPRDEELEIIRLTTATYRAQLEKVLSGEDIITLQNIVRKVPISDHVLEYATNFARYTRPNESEAPDFVREWVSWGAGPRAAQFLVLGGKARAILSGRFYVNGDDIRAVAHPTLRHRIITNFAAEAEGITPDAIVDKLIQVVPRNESETLSDGKLPKVLGS